MGIVAFDAIVRRALMLHLRLLDLLSNFCMAGQAELFRGSFPQHHLSILGRLVTHGAGGLKRRMHVLQYQLRPRGLMRIVAGEATGIHKRLPPVSLNQLGIIRIMTILAQSRRVLLQLEIEFPLASFARLMNRVAGVAALIQSGVAAAPIFNADTHFVAGQAETLVLPCARNGL